MEKITNIATYILAFVWGYSSLTYENLMILGILMSIDFFTGMVKGLALYKKIDSHKATVGALKKAFIFSTPSIIGLMGGGTGMDTSAVEFGLYTMLVIGEVISIFENILIIHTRQVFKKFDIYSLAANKVLVFLEKILKPQNFENGDKDDKI